MDIWNTTRSRCVGRHSRLLLLMAAGILISPQHAMSAGPSYTFSERDVYAGVLSGPGGEDTRIRDETLVYKPGTQSIQEALSSSSSTPPFNLGQASASIRGNVDTGRIGILATASISGGSLDAGSSQGFLTLGWGDELTLWSPTLPAGTLVDVYLGTSLERVVSQGQTILWNPQTSTPTERAADYSVASGVVNGSFSFQYGSGGGGTTAFDYPTMCGGPANTAGGCVDGYAYNSKDFTIQAQVGDRIAVQSYLAVGTFAGWGGSVGVDLFEAQASIDGSNTMSFAFKVLTPNVFYTAESGTEFASALPVPVPEPSSALCILSGLVLILVMVSRTVGMKREAPNLAAGPPFPRSPQYIVVSE